MSNKELFGELRSLCEEFSSDSDGMTFNLCADRSKNVETIHNKSTIGAKEIFPRFNHDARLWCLIESEESPSADTLKQPTQCGNLEDGIGRRGTQLILINSFEFSTLQRHIKNETARAANKTVFGFSQFFSLFLFPPLLVSAHISIMMTQWRWRMVTEKGKNVLRCVRLFVDKEI